MTWLALKLFLGRIGKLLTAVLAAILKFTTSPAGGIAFGALAIFLGALWLTASSDLRGSRKDLAKARALIAKYDAAAEAAAKHVAAVVVERKDTTAKIEKGAAERAVQIRTVTQQIIKEVPTYVTPKADAACTVPGGFVRLHDDAAAGRVSAVPGGSGLADEAPSGLALSDVGRTVASNYGQCGETANQLISLQEWVRAMAKSR